MKRNQTLFAGPIAVVIVLSAALSGCLSPGDKAARSGDAVQLQQILDQPNHGGEEPNDILYYSIWYDCAECARVALKMGAKASTGALRGAAERGQSKIASLLIDYGAEPSAAFASIQEWYSEHSGVNSYLNNPAKIQGAADFFKKLELERASRPAAAVAAQPAPAAAADQMRVRATPLFHEAEHPDDYALIVGIEKYDGLPAATFAERDAASAADFAAAMGVPTRNISTLTGDHATRAGLVKKLEGWLANNANANSTVYFYYSGHGAPDTKTGQAYLVPFDGDPEYLDQTGYPLKRVYEKLGALKAKRVIVMLDSCFSGAGGRSVLAKGARPLVSNVDAGFDSAGGKVTVLSATGADQISGTAEEKGHGLFSYYLFNGLNGAAKDASGQVTVNSLFAYLKPKVMDEAQKSNREQVPQLRSEDSAEANVVLRGK